MKIHDFSLICLWCFGARSVVSVKGQSAERSEVRSYRRLLPPSLSLSTLDRCGGDDPGNSRMGSKPKSLK